MNRCCKSVTKKGFISCLDLKHSLLQCRGETWLGVIVTNTCAYPQRHIICVWDLRVVVIKNFIW